MRSWRGLGTGIGELEHHQLKDNSMHPEALKNGETDEISNEFHMILANLKMNLKARMIKFKVRKPIDVGMRERPGMELARVI